MREENEQPSWPDGSQEEIAHLFARREYLTERMEAATDPNLRSSFAYEISVLEARLADLTKPPKTTQTGNDGYNTDVSAPVDQTSGDLADAAPGSDWPNDHDGVPEEFFQTLEISSIDLDTASWPANAARPASPTPQPQQVTDQPLHRLEPLEYRGDEYHRDHTNTADQPMAALPPADNYQPDYNGNNGNGAHHSHGLNGSFAEAARPEAGESHMSHNGHGAGYGNGDGQEDYVDPADVNYDENFEQQGFEKQTFEQQNFEEQDFVPENAEQYDEVQAEHDGFEYDDQEQYEQYDELEPEYDELAAQGNQHDEFVDVGVDEPVIDLAHGESEDPEQLFRAEHHQFEAQQQARQHEDLDYFGRPMAADEGSQPTRIELPKSPERPISTAMSGRRRRQTPPEQAQPEQQAGQPTHEERQPSAYPSPVEASNRGASQQQPPRRPGQDTGEHRYFADEQSANTESEVHLDGFDRDRFRVAPALVVAGVCLAALAGVLWFGGRGTTTEAAQSIASGGKAPSQASAQGPELAVANVRAVLDELGLENVVVDSRNEVVHVGGPVATQADLDSVSAAVKAVAGEYEVDTTALVILEPGSTDSPASTTPAPASPVAGAGSALLQSELDRILAVTPLIFDTGQADLTALHQRVLNNVVLVLQNQPDGVVTITGYTDEEGTNSANRQISLSRAENVKAYLVSQGINADALNVDARGEESATGSSALAGLERRVEFEVQTAPGGAAKTGPIRVALVAPSAMNDLAFTQSMVDSLNLMVDERGIEVSITDNTFVPEEAAAAIDNYAAQGFDLIIAHGSQFGASLIDIAPRYPTTAFAWGTASDTFGLPNVYAYDAAAEEGGYVLGTVAAMMSANKITGVVGPIDVGDAGQYVKGYQAGAAAQDPASNVLVSFTGSFSDITLASEAAQAHIDGGADILTGSAQMVVGAISTADSQGVKWFGTQANQASLAPNSVVASQVYRWDVALRPILDDVAAGSLSGSKYTANLANGGLVIEFNDGVPVAPEVLQRANEVTNAIVSGQIDP